MILVFCEGRRNANFAETVIEFFKIASALGKESREFQDAINKIEKDIKKFVGYIRSIYRKQNRDYIYVFEIGNFSKIYKERQNLKSIFDELKEKYKIVFVVDSEYTDLVKFYDLEEESIIFSERIEDFIKRIVNKILSEENIEKLRKIKEELKKECRIFLNKVDEDKLEIQLYHIVFSGGECDKRMFSTLLKLLGNDWQKEGEIKKLYEILRE